MGFQVGADLRVIPELLAGVAVAWAQGAFDYRDRSTAARTVTGVYETELLSVHPYAGWSSPGAGLGLWMSAGYGWGEVRIDDDLSAGRHTSAVRLVSGAVGGSGRLLATDALIAGGTTLLRLQGEGFLARVDVDGSGPIAPLALDSRRLRLLLAGSHAQSLPWGGRLTPELDVGLRYDDGDGPQGAGLELGGELSYADPRLGLTVQGHGRLLATHRSAYEEWGAGGLLRLELGIGGRGLWLSVAPSWGDAAGGAAALWERGVAVRGSRRGGRRWRRDGGPPRRAGRLRGAGVGRPRPADAVRRVDGGRRRRAPLPRRGASGDRCAGAEPGGRAPRARRRTGQSRRDARRRTALLSGAGTESMPSASRFCLFRRKMMRRRTWVRAGGGGYLDGAPGSRPVGLRTGAVRLRCATGICMSALALLALSGCQRAATGGGPGVEPPPSDDHGDDRAAATVIAPADTPLSGRLETAGDVDYFKVAVTAGSVRIMAAVAAAAGPAPMVTIEDLREDASNAGAVAWSDLPSPRPRHVYLKVTGRRAASYRLAVWLVTPNEPRSATS